MDKKTQILKAAVSVMEQKGPEAKISEIAAAASVNNSVIYHYFKDKEDLLFCAVGEHVRSTNDAFVEHIKQVGDPVIRLKELIREQLHYHDTHPNYTKYTLFYCRSKKSFFRHDSFKYFIRWARLLRQILEDGVSAQIFSPDLPVRVAQDMMLGYLDMESIDFFTGRRPLSPENDFDDILAMFMLLLTDDGRHLPPEQTKREKILTVAEEIFAGKDYSKATTLEIAKAACVSEATLYEFFENKEDLLLSGLQYRLAAHRHIAETFFDSRTPLIRLVRFIYYHFTLHVRQPAFVKNFILNGIFNEEFYTSAAYADFDQYMAIVDRIVEDGKAEGSMRADLDPRQFRNLLLGVFSHSALRSFFAEDRNKFEMMGHISEMTTLLLKMVRKPGRTLAGPA